MQQKLSYYAILFIGTVMTLISCSDDDATRIPMQFSNVEYQEAYELLPGDTLIMNPNILNIPEEVTFSWELNESQIATTQNLETTVDESGFFTLVFTATSATEVLTRNYEITVHDPYDLYFRPKSESSKAYISKILEYTPAPGQYINDTYGTLEDAEKIVGGKSNTLSLGAWGGYVIFSFDHTIINQEDAADFVVYGNAMNGLSEPGIVQVSFDENGNGLADDTWYELSGSAHKTEEAILDYKATYTNPKANADVPWVDNQGASGSILVNAYHTQNYYPLFIEEQEEVTFMGSKVHTHINSEGFISIDALEWGYVDNYDADYSTYLGNAMDIDWATDNTLNPVNLKGIDFVKVYTGVQGNAGWLGEISTEIKGAADLSMIE